MNEQYVVTATDFLGNVFIYVGRHNWIWSEAPKGKFKIYKQRQWAVNRMKEEEIHDSQYRPGLYIAYHVRLYDGATVYGTFQE